MDAYERRNGECGVKNRRRQALPCDTDALRNQAQSRRTDKIQQGPMYKGFGGRGEHRGILPFSKSRVPPIPSVASKPGAFLTDLGDVDD